MHKKILTGLIVASTMFPVFAFAQTTTDLQTQIQSILSQIQALQMQLKTLIASSSAAGIPIWTGSTTPPFMGGGGNMMPPGQIGKMVCVTLNRDLKIGSQGDDVKNIQQMLSQHPESGFSESATGFFGPMTAKAMMMFQMRNGIASSTDGHVGPLTRGFFERHCGEGLGNGDGGQGMGGMMNGGAITGSITANTGSSITISEKSGTSRVVNITASTTIQIFSTSTAPIAGSVSDLTVGKMGGAKGTLNSDGSIQAMMIMVGMVPPPPPMMNGDDHGGMKPYGVMPTASSTQGGHGDFHGGAQNW